MCSHRHAILHLPAKFRRNQKIIVMTSYPFLRWPQMAAGSHIWFDLGNVRPPTKCNCRSQLGPIYSFGDTAIFIFCCFGLKLPIHAHFGGVLGAYIWSPIVQPQKDHPCAETRRLSHKAWKSAQWFDLGIRSRTKVRPGQDSQKSHKVILFHLFGEKPPLYRLKLKFAWRVILPIFS